MQAPSQTRIFRPDAEIPFVSQPEMKALQSVR